LDLPSKFPAGSRLDSCFLAFFGVKPVALQMGLMLQGFTDSPRLLPIPPTANVYKLNGSSFGRPDVDLMSDVYFICHVLACGL
jgi:hypothetical protein